MSAATVYSMAAPSPMMRALDVATRLVAQAQQEGVEVGCITLLPAAGVRIYAEDDTLAPALAVALGLTRRTVHRLDNGEFEFFDGEVDGVAVQTHGRVPEPKRIAWWHCPCGAEGELLAGASDEDAADYEESLVVHTEACEVTVR